jgi:hypothetical protein
MEDNTKTQEQPKVDEKPKIVNLFEDTGNHHDEEELRKSYERVSEQDKH